MLFPIKRENCTVKDFEVEIEKPTPTRKVIKKIHQKPEDGTIKEIGAEIDDICKTLFPSDINMDTSLPSKLLCYESGFKLTSSLHSSYKSINYQFQLSI